MEAVQQPPNQLETNTHPEKWPRSTIQNSETGMARQTTPVPQSTLQASTHTSNWWGKFKHHVNMLKLGQNIYHCKRDATQSVTNSEKKIIQIHSECGMHFQNIHKRH